MNGKHTVCLSKRSVSHGRTFLIAAVFVLAILWLALPLRVHAVDYGGDISDLTIEEAAARSDIQPGVYDALGLTMSPEVPEGKAAPYSDTHAFSLVDRREVYMSANGSKSNQYVVRDGLDILGPSSLSSQGHKDMKSSSGASWGAYKLWDINKNNMFEKHGNTTDSYLASNNSKVVMKKDAAHYDGKYATSVAFSASAGDDAKKDHVAELRAFHGNASQKYRGNDEWYSGLIRIDLFSFDKDGTRHEDTNLLPTLHASQFLDTDGYKELNYLDFGYLQEYDAYFELEAADVDGDGIDELFAYTGAYEDKDGHRNAIVYMFRSTNGKDWTYSMVYLDTGLASNYQTIDDLKKENSKHWRQMVARLAPVVTLAACDLDRNGTEEIAITTSAPAGHKAAADASRARVFHWDKEKKNVVTVEGLDDIALSGADGKALTSANCASGVFLYTRPAYTYTINMFLFAGWETNGKGTTDNSAWENFGYRYVFYNPDTESYEISEYTTHALGKDAKIIADSAAKHSTGSGRYMTTMAPFALGCARLETLSNDITSDYVLAGGDIYRLALTADDNTGQKPGLGVTGGSISLFSGQYHHQSGVAEINKPKDHIWIGDVVSGCVAGDTATHESFLAVVGVRRDDDVRGSDDYYWFDVAHYTFENGNPARKCTGQEGVINESTRMGKVSGPNLSLCLPDIDDDSIRMRLVDQTVFPTAPQVLVVLQDTPYFSDLQEVYHYLSSGHTSFGGGHEENIGNGFSLHLAAGFHGIAEWGTALAASVDIGGKLAGSYDFQWQSAHGSYVTYSAQGGKGNKVVVCAVPYVYSLYDVFDPETGTWKQMWQTEPLDPVTSVVSIETWDEIAKNSTKTLPLIDVDPENLGTVIGSTCGDPATYTPENLGGRKWLDSGKISSVSSNTGEGSTVEQKATLTSGTSWNLNVEYEINITTGFGIGLADNKAMAGPVGEFAAGYERSVVESDTSEFYGAVDNLPSLEGVAGDSSKYSFQWQMQVNVLQYSKDEKSKYKKENKRKLDDVYLVGYNVIQEGFEQPALRMVPDTRIDNITNDSVTLSWKPMEFGEKNNDKDAFYRVGRLASDGSGKVSHWDYIEADPHPVPQNGRIDRIRYVVSDLDPSTNYQFIVQAVRGTRRGTSFTPVSSSIRSSTLTAVTLKEGESIQILSQPENLAPLKQGEDALYKTSARWTKQTGDNSDKITYIWESLNHKTGLWDELGDGEGDSIIEPDLSNTSGTAAMTGNAPLNAVQEAGTPKDSSESMLFLKSVPAKKDGLPIRCSVGFDGQVICSSDVVLYVDAEDDKAAVSQRATLIQTRTSTGNALWFKTAAKGEGRFGTDGDKGIDNGIDDEKNDEYNDDGNDGDDDDYDSDDDDDGSDDEDSDENKKKSVRHSDARHAGPATGDHSHAGRWLVLLLAAMAGLGIAVWLRRRTG